MRVLVSRLSSLGDVVCTLPAATAIKRQWPDSEVSWVVDKRFRSVVDCCHAVDHVHERPSRAIVAREWGEFDVALDMQGLLKSSILVALARAKRRLGYHWQREGSWLVSQRVLPDPSSLHIVDQLVDVARALGCAAEEAEFSLAPRDEDVERVSRKLAAQGWTGSQTVVLNAGAGWSSKRWAAPKYAKLADRLHAEGAQCVFLGSAADRNVWDEVRSHGAARALDMVGETNIAELIALVSLATVHVGGDTGSTHLAAALGRPAVGLYTITKPERSCPYGQIHNCFSGDPSVGQVMDTIVRNLRTAT